MPERLLGTSFPEWEFPPMVTGAAACVPSHYWGHREQRDLGAPTWRLLRMASRQRRNVRALEVSKHMTWPKESSSVATSPLAGGIEQPRGCSGGTHTRTWPGGSYHARLRCRLRHAVMPASVMALAARSQMQIVAHRDS